MFEQRLVQLYPPRELIYSIGDSAASRKAVTKSRGRVDSLVSMSFLQTNSYAAGPSDAAPFEAPAVVKWNKRYGGAVPVDSDSTMESEKRLRQANIAAQAAIGQGAAASRVGDDSMRENRFDNALFTTDLAATPSGQAGEVMEEAPLDPASYIAALQELGYTVTPKAGDT